jgi:Bax protein
VKAFERSALGLVALLTTGLVIATAVAPPSPVTASPRAVAEDQAAAEDPTGRPWTLTAWRPVRTPKTVEKLSLRPRPTPVAFRTPGLAARPKIQDVFASLGYDLENVGTGRTAVPRLFLASMPPDLARIREVKARKTLFFKTVLPLVLRVNEEILETRARLWTLGTRRAMGLRLAAEDRLWLMVMGERRYGVAADDIGGLLERVDVVAPSLALAQAAAESGWGTSRFAREGNAVFGEWTFSEARKALTPARRDDGKSHRVRAFDSLLESVRAYVHNLNTHRAYGPFREKRAEMRRRGEPLDGLALAAGLIQYSEERAEYVQKIRSIIRVNGLRHLDDARLSASRSSPEI